MDRLELNGTHQVLVCANENLLYEYINTINRSTEALSVGSNEAGQEVNAKKAMHMFMPPQKVHNKTMIYKGSQ
jgi:hypothetical protein